MLILNRIRPKAGNPQQPSLSYFKVLPHNDHQLDPRAWVQNPPFLRFEHLRASGLFGSGRFYRFLALIDDETVSLHLGFPPDKKRSVESALRGACPKVTLIEEKNPLKEFFNEEERNTAFAIAFKAKSALAPFNCDESLAEFQSMLGAFGAGRRDGVKGLFDVCFEHSPADKKRLVSGLQREIEKLYGVNNPLIGGVDLGASTDAIIGALCGGKKAPIIPKQQKQVSRLMPVDKDRVSAYMQRMCARGVFRARIRAAVSAKNPKMANSCLMAVGGALQSIHWHNELVWARKRGGLVRDIIEGKIGFAEPSFLMTERELAQIIVIPGQEMDYVWRILERMPSRTAPPPLSLLGGDEEDVSDEPNE